MRVAVVQLGCPKNLVDGENLMGQLVEAGHESVGNLDAEAVIVNTCGFIDSAKEESIGAILRVAELKKSGRVKRLIVAGCLVQRYRDELKREISEIDGFIPLSAASDAVRLLNEPTLDVKLSPEIPILDGLVPRVLSTPPHLAYVKIADGCDNRCAFCSIPGFRGAFHSRPLSDIVREATGLVEGGVREIVLVAQDTTAYGLDLGMKEGLAELLSALDERTGAEWIRILYAYPNRVTTALIEAMAECGSVVPYIDIPLQHASSSILKTMARGGSSRTFLDLISRLRSTVEGIAVRSTFIVGFPGEGESEFQELTDFLEEVRLENVGVFPYSREEGTSAWTLGDPVPAEVKNERVRRLMELQQKISACRNRAMVGETRRVLIEGACEETEHLLQGRLAVQAPEIDGHVLINDGFAAPGTFADVIITQAGSYDLVGGIVER